MKKSLMLSGLVLLLAACGSQDPMKNQSDDVKNGNPPGVNKPKETVEAKDIVFDNEEFYTIKEGESVTITVNARYLKNAEDFEIIFKNQEQFENVQVSTVKGSHTGKGLTPAKITITWIPKIDNGDFMKKTSFDFLISIPELGVSTSKSIPVFIERKLETPSILRQENMPSVMREGDVAMAVIYVMDVTAEDQDGKRPVLSVDYESKGVPQISPYIGIGAARSVGNHTWAFDIRFDLQAELTDSQYSTNVRFVAKNRFGLVSTHQEYPFEIKTNLLKPTITWINKSEVNFKVGQKNAYSFMILDSRFEGDVTWDVSASELAKWPGTASFDCQYVTAPNGASKSQAVCTLTWDIPPGTKDALKNLKLTVKNSSKLTGDTFSTEEHFDRQILITP